MKVRAQQGDSVDSLCFRHLGTTDAVEPTLELNPGLSALGAVLPQGTLVELPDEAPAPTEQRIVNLWD